MVDYREDIVAWPVMTALLGCLKRVYEDRKLDLGRQMIGIGAQRPPEDFGTDEYGSPACGSLQWVRLVGLAPASEAFPQPDFSRVFAKWYRAAITLEVGIVRCVSVGLADGAGAEPEEIFEAARIQMADMAAMREAICVCLTERGQNFALGPYAPTITSGGVNGGLWTVTVEWVKGAKPKA